LAIPAVAHLGEESHVAERRENLLAGFRINGPKPNGLVHGQLKTGGFLEFPSDALDELSFR
jgi:hypothetical protein